MKKQTYRVSRSLWSVLSALFVLALALSPLTPVGAGTLENTASQPAIIENQDVGGQDENGSAAPLDLHTSAFLAGKVAVGLVVVESNITGEHEENWTVEELQKVHAEVRAGLQKWVDWKPSGLSLEFVLDVTGDAKADDPFASTLINDFTKHNYYVPVSDEPIIYSSGLYSIWGREALVYKGYTAGSTTESAAYQYANDLRAENNADWAFVLFVVDSSVDVTRGDGTLGAFSDNVYLRAKTFGPVAILTNSVGTRGADDMEWATAQLVARMFGAGFQREDFTFESDGCGSPTKKFGYLGIANSYCAVPGGENRLMYHGTGAPDSTTRQQVGWRDADEDGIIDPLDTILSVLFSPYYENPTTDTTPTYQEPNPNPQNRRYRAYDNPLAAAICAPRFIDECFYSHYYDRTAGNLAVTINKIQNVQFRVDGAVWNDADAQDGAFNSDYEIYTFTTPTLEGGKRKIEVRAQNSAGNYSKVMSDTLTVAAAPVNDLFENRIKFASLPYSHAVNTTSATPTQATYATDSDPIPNYPPSCENTRRGLHSVWYEYKAQSTDTIYADTYGSDYTTVLSVWKEKSGGGLELVTCQDGSLNDLVRVQFDPSNGTSYYFMITEFNNLSGGSATGTSEVSGQKGGVLAFRVYNAIEIDVTIGGNLQGKYFLKYGEEKRQYYNLSGGPVKVESKDGNQIVSAIRLQSYANNTLYSFVETMGVPSGLLSYKYVFPTYNNTWGPLNSQIRFGNLDTTSTRIRVMIGGVNVWEQDVLGLEERRLYFPMSGGPVVIESLDTSKKIVAAIRLQSYGNDTLYSFSETMGIPTEYVSHKYYFPTYNNTWAPLNSQIRFGNLESTTTRIRVTIGGVNVWEDDVPGLQERRLTFPVSGGPVVVESLDTSKKIVAAIRLQSYANNILYSFIETMGVPDGLLSHKYYFPTYNNTWAPLNSQVRFGNLSATTTRIRVTIGGVNVWEDDVPGLQERRLTFAVSGGPVIIESLDASKKIVAAIRLQSYANNILYSFAETMGIPAEQMATNYYFPTYNNTWGPLNSQLRFGVP